jgi:glutamate-1-semialdehyde aminotransferase
MGGLACILVVRSTLTFTTVPTDPIELAAFDAQMRKVHYSAEYSQSLVNEATELAKAAADIMEKHTNTWTLADRQKLLAGVNKVCGGYS